MPIGWFDSFSGFPDNCVDESDDFKYLKRDKNIYNNFKIMKNKTYKWEFNRYYLTRV